jgi:hypothetical protein
VQLEIQIYRITMQVTMTCGNNGAAVPHFANLSKRKKFNADGPHGTLLCTKFLLDTLSNARVLISNDSD